MQTYHFFEWLKNSKFLPVQFFHSCKLTCMVSKICIHIISLKIFELFPFSNDKMGVPIHVLSYNLLLNYTSAFLRIGSSEIGFRSAHNSRMQFQYGAEQEVWLPCSTLFPEHSGTHQVSSMLLAAPRRSLWFQ